MRTYNCFSNLLILICTIVLLATVLLINLIVKKIKKYNKVSFCFKYIFWAQAIICCAFFQWYLALMAWMLVGGVLFIVIKRKMKSFRELNFKSFVYTFLSTMICIVVLPLLIKVLKIPNLNSGGDDIILTYIENLIYITSIILFFYVIGYRPFATTPSEIFIPVDKKETEVIGKTKKIVNIVIYILVFIFAQTYYSIFYFLNI